MTGCLLERQEKLWTFERKAEGPVSPLARSLAMTSAWTLEALSLGCWHVVDPRLSRNAVAERACPNSWGGAREELAGQAVRNIPAAETSKMGREPSPLSKALFPHKAYLFQM